jgi:glutathione peroxidase
MLRKFLRLTFAVLISFVVLIPPASSAPPANSTATLSSLRLTTLDGSEFTAASLEGKVVLVVNVASFCSYTPQYASLQTLYDRFKSRGFVVLGVPCNQFAGQEPGSASEIASFCSTRYGVAFPMLAKQDVNGDTRSALYQWLVNSQAGGGRDVGWNFEKFLVGRNGRVIGRFGSHVVPLDPTLVAAIDFALGTTP